MYIHTVHDVFEWHYIDLLHLYFFIQQARIHQLEKQLECTSVELSRVQVQCITMLV